MAATNLVDSLFHFYFDNLTKKEKVLLEIIFFVYLYHELIDFYKEKYNHNMEGSMINGFVIRGLVNDLLINEEYSIQGLANYTGYPEDVICDVAAGMNTNPTLILSAKIVELHAVARRDFYHDLIKKIMSKLLGES